MKKVLFLFVLFCATTVFAQKMDQPARWGQIQGTLTDQTDLSAAITAACGLTNATIKATTFYSTTNVTLTLSETCDQWVWTPPTNVPLRITFADLPTTSGGSGFFSLARTNNDNSVAWLNTNITFYANGTRATNAPTLANYNDFTVVWINGKIRVGLVSTNGVDL